MNTINRPLKAICCTASAAVIFGALCALGSCTGANVTSQSSAYSSQGGESNTALSSAAASSGTKSTEAASKAGAAEYKMSTFTDAANAESTVKIEYPVFSGENADKINAAVTSAVKALARLEGDYYEQDAVYTAEYKSQVTLNNGKAVSAVFWGDVTIKNSAHPYTDIKTLNLDAKTAKEITLSQLYDTNEGFKKVFFEKAFFPDDPVTSYDKASFAEMLKMQSPEYQTVSPFDTDGVVSFYLTGDAIVFSMPAVHATGSDHFEGGIKYSDIKQYEKSGTASYID